MSSMMNKVKDALKPGHEDKHASAMPGSFDSDSPHATSKHASEPTQASYSQDQSYPTNQGLGAHPTGTHTTGAGPLSSGGTHRQRDDHLMDPADHSHGSNVMDRDRGDYSTNTHSSGPNVLHHRDDPRSNYDNSGRAARNDQEAYLRQQEVARKGLPGEHGTTTSGSAYDHSDKSQQPHNSNLLNKLDPRVDSTKTADHDRRQDHQSGLGGATAGGIAGGAAASQYHSRDLPNRSRDEYNTTGGTTGSGIDSGHGTDHRDQAYGTVPGTHTSRQNDPYSTSTTTNTTTTGATHGHGLSSNQTHHNQDPHHDHQQQSTLSKLLPGHHGDKSHSNDPHSSSTTTSHGTSALRKHFHCMNCGHKNDASHIRDAEGKEIAAGRQSLFCMSCGHRNEVGGLFGLGQGQKGY